MFKPAMASRLGTTALRGLVRGASLRHASVVATKGVRHGGSGGKGERFAGGGSGWRWTYFAAGCAALAGGGVFTASCERSKPATVLAWGGGINGELGTGSTRGSNSTPFSVELPSDVTLLAAGEGFSAAATRYATSPRCPSLEPALNAVDGWGTLILTRLPVIPGGEVSTRGATGGIRSWGTAT